MKKFLEKHDVFKLSGLFVLLYVVLSWLIRSASYVDGTLSTTEITRIGIFDLSTYGLLAVYNFITVFAFLFIVAGFYKLLGSTEVYNKLTDNIAKVCNGKVLVAISILVFACLAGISTDYFVLFAIVPFIISVLSKLKVDKVTGLIATFGGILVGVLGSTYSTKVVGLLADPTGGLGVTYGYELVGVILLFVITYLLLTGFTIVRMGKVNNDTELLEDPFVTIKEETKKDKKKVNRRISVAPLLVVLLITFVTLIMAFIGWDDAFGITIFSDAYKWVTEATLFGEVIYYHSLGSVLPPFGQWDLLTAAGLICIATFIIKIIYHIPLDKIIDEYLEGFKTIGKSALVLVVVYLLAELAYFYPIIPALVDIIMSFGSNIGTLFISGLLTSLFSVEFQFVFNSVGSLFANFSNINVAALALQTSYGVISFIAPTSVMLVLGLSMLDIKYKDYLKFIWKFLLALIVIVLVVLAILMYV